jgi:hypothetical protein
VGIGVGFRAALCAGALFALLCIAHAEETEPAGATPPPATHRVPANTEVHLRLIEPVASNTHKRGDRFPLEVVEPVLVDGTPVIPIGTRGEGEVVHAAKSGFGGKAGELILVARWVQVGDLPVRLRSFSAGNGKDRVNLAIGLSFAVIGIFVTGKDISLPAGTDVFAKVAADSPLPAALAAAPAAADDKFSSTMDPASTEIEKNETSEQ